MKNMLHPDYWIEIPAGEYQVGLSAEHRRIVSDRVFSQIGYERRKPRVQALLDSAAAKIRRRVELTTAFYRERLKNGYAEPRPPLPREWWLSDEEDALLSSKPFDHVWRVEHDLANVPLPIAVAMDRYYIAKFPLTIDQDDALRRGVSPASLPGALEEPAERREVGRGDLLLLKALDCRVPTRLEWERAARGEDGRLYPWGNEWDLEAGYFYYQQLARTPLAYHVDGFPRGVSPFGLWGMIGGGFPELVTYKMNTPGVQETAYTTKGCRDNETTPESAWYDYIVVFPGKGDKTALRPVLDKWPVQQWPGFTVPEKQN